MFSFDEFDPNARPIVQVTGDGGTQFEGDGEASAPTDTSILHIVAGAAHTCALRADGEVRCWGANDSGQLGDGSLSTRGAAVRVANLTGATAVAAGRWHTCAIVAGGAVWCWGKNGSGQLGDRTGRDQSRPVRALGITGATHLALGEYDSCAATADGSLFCWGDRFGSRPVRISTSFANIRALVFSRFSTPCALTNAGRVHCFRSETETRQIDGLENAIDVVVDLDRGCAVLANGEIKCWSSPDGVRSFATVPAIPAATAIAARPAQGAGLEEVCAVAGGTVWCWNFGEAPAPKPFVAAREIALGYGHGCLLRSNVSDVRCWGTNDHGQLGDDSYRVTSLAARSIAQDAPIALGYGHICYRDGTRCLCMGGNNRGQLGNGSTTASATPVEVTDLGGAPTSLAAGEVHTCAVVGGLVRCWGASGTESEGNSRGQLGDGTYDQDRHSPVTALGISNAVAVSTARTTTCALLASGEVWCWGDNSFGQLGVSRDVKLFDATPSKVPGISGATAVGVGLSHACAIVANGGVACWGEVSGSWFGSGAVSIASGWLHSCVVTSAGDAACFGNGGPGIGGLDGKSAIAVAAGHVDYTIGVNENHSCFALANGTVTCWGSNDYGQLGNGTFSPQDHVDAVSEITTATRVFAGYARSCALLSNGDLRCWGADGASFRRSDLPLVVVGL